MNLKFKSLSVLSSKIYSFFFFLIDVFFKVFFFNLIKETFFLLNTIKDFIIVFIWNEIIFTGEKLQ